jgi:hypothetical protein
VGEPDFLALDRLIDEGEDLPAEFGDGDFHESSVP